MDPVGRAIEYLTAVMTKKSLTVEEKRKYLNLSLFLAEDENKYFLSLHISPWNTYVLMKKVLTFLNQLDNESILEGSPLEGAILRTAHRNIEDSLSETLLQYVNSNFKNDGNTNIHSRAFYSKVTGSVYLQEWELDNKTMWDLILFDPIFFVEIDLPRLLSLSS